MTTDGKIQLAEKIENELSDVTRAEWNKWQEFFVARKDLNKALRLASAISQSPSFRFGPQKANRQIFNVLNKRKNELQKISFKDLIEIFGFVGWRLSLLKRGFGMWKEEKEA